MWRRFEALLNDGRQIRGNLFPDAYLAAIALSDKATLATRDRGFARFRDLAWLTWLGPDTNSGSYIPRRLGITEDP